MTPGKRSVTRLPRPPASTAVTGQCQNKHHDHDHYDQVASQDKGTASKEQKQQEQEQDQSHVAFLSRCYRFYCQLQSNDTSLKGFSSCDVLSHGNASLIAPTPDVGVMTDYTSWFRNALVTIDAVGWRKKEGISWIYSPSSSSSWFSPSCLAVSAFHGVVARKVVLCRSANASHEVLNAEIGRPGSDRNLTSRGFSRVD
jgi:hypothetical protein